MWRADSADSKQVQESSGLFPGDGLPQPARRGIFSEYILRRYDSFLEDDNDDRRAVSRMVSNLAINGVVNAAQKAAELVASREAEVVGLKEDFKELLLEQQVQGEIEKILIGNVLRSLREEFETKLGDQNVRLRGDRRTASPMHKFEEISGLRKHLDAIQKSLSGLEAAQLSSHGSLETDHLHLKSSNRVSPTSGLTDEFNTGLPENRESSPSRHMNFDELYHFFRRHLTKMKRDHESAIQAMIEGFFCLKRERLKERGPCFPFQNKKDLDLLRKKILEVIVELDEVLLDNKEVSEICNVSWDKLESLISENQRLRSLVATKSDEVEYLTSQLSDASEKSSQHSLDDAKLNELIRDLESRVQDTQIEASVSEEVCKSYTMELLLQIACDVEESNTKSAVTRESIEVIYKETALTSDFGDDSDFQSTVLQGISGIVFEEVLESVGMELKSLNMKCLGESERVESLECNALETERSLAKAAGEKSTLKHEMAMLEASVEDKVKLVAELTNTLESEREVLKRTQIELMDYRVQHDRELDDIKVKLEEYMEKNALCEEEIAIWKERLGSVEKERSELVMREKNNIRLAEAKDAEQRKQMESTIPFGAPQSHVVSRNPYSFQPSSSLDFSTGTGGGGGGDVSLGAEAKDAEQRKQMESTIPFGAPQSHVVSQNPYSFQPSSSLDFSTGTGGGIFFSLGAGGRERSNRRIVKCKSKFRYR